jgi:adenine phosphoribosyltransferase
MERETYPIEIAGVNRKLRLFEIKPGLRIAILNILGDTELVTACASRAGRKASSCGLRCAGDRRSKEHSAGACCF